jgi:lanthanide-dependent methanol dehydrogenase
MSCSESRGRLTLLAVVVASSVAFAQASSAQQQNAPGPSGDLVSLSKDANNWPMAPRDYANTRFSALDQINTNNVSNLRVAWTFSVGADKGQEAAPLIVSGTMYVVAPYAGPHPNQVFALDAATGELKWSYAPKPDLTAQGVACCDVVTRGLAYDNGKVFLNTLDGYSVGIDAKTGKELFHTKIADIQKGETITMAPLVVKGKVLIGNSGGELGVRGWVTAVDENSGKIAWRAYHTGPDSEVLIGPDERPGPRREDLAAGCLEDRRRNDVGLDPIRSGPRYDLLRHRQSGAVESYAASGRQFMDDDFVRPQSGHRTGEVGLSDEPARSLRL